MQLLRHALEPRHLRATGRAVIGPQMHDAHQRAHRTLTALRRAPLAARTIPHRQLWQSDLLVQQVNLIAMALLQLLNALQ